MPYPPCTVTISRLKYQDSARCLRRVTQPPFIAGPLCTNIALADHSAITSANNKIYREKTHSALLPTSTAIRNMCLDNFLSGEYSCCLTIIGASLMINPRRYKKLASRPSLFLTSQIPRQMIFFYDTSYRDTQLVRSYYTVKSKISNLLLLWSPPIFYPLPGFLANGNRTIS